MSGSVAPVDRETAPGPLRGAGAPSRIVFSPTESAANPAGAPAACRTQPVVPGCRLTPRRPPRPAAAVREGGFLIVGAIALVDDKTGPPPASQVALPVTEAERELASRLVGATAPVDRERPPETPRGDPRVFPHRHPRQQNSPRTVPTDAAARASGVSHSRPADPAPATTGFSSSRPGSIRRTPRPAACGRGTGTGPRGASRRRPRTPRGPGRSGRASRGRRAGSPRPGRRPGAR